MNTSPIWHPFTQHGLFPDSIAIESAKGLYLHTKDGRKIMDGVSSWWINTHGHCHPKIVEAVKEQAGKLDQVIFAGFTHEPAEKLARKLVDVTGRGLDYVFFSDSGSTSVEVALKMAIGYWHNTGRPRKTVIALEHGYHGDTFGTMAVGARSVYNAAYDPYLFDVIHIPFPADDAGENTLEAFRKILSSRAQDIAAFICEPLVLGAGGMLMYSPAVLKGLHDLCADYGIFFIADEVMTGFGRTGTLFACEQAGIVPDILCLSKGLTGGYMPLAVTLCSGDIYRAFYSRDRVKTFFHSSSYTGNALACAAALASLEIWEDEPVRRRISDLTLWQQENLATISRREDVIHARQMGTIAAFDVRVQAGSGYLSGVGSAIHDYCLKHDVLLRPLGNTVYVMPPYVITQSELAHLYAVLEDALNSLAQA